MKIMEWSPLTKFHPNKLVPAPEGVAWGGTLLMVGPDRLPKPVGPDGQALCGEAGRFGQGLPSPAWGGPSLDCYALSSGRKEGETRRTRKGQTGASLEC